MTDGVVLIVGASSGIGLATALRMASTGHRLVLVARDPDALARAQTACRQEGASDVRIVAADVGVKADVQRAVAAVLDAHGRIDVVIQTATVMAYGSIENIPDDVFTAVIDTAVHGTLHLAQAVLPVLRRQKRGTFIVVNSLLGSVTVPNMGAYATSKWGQRAIVRTLQQETRDERDVHVCVVSPASINTPIYYQAANYVYREVRPPVPVLQPDRAATAIMGLLDRPRNHVSVPVGPGNPIIITGFRLMPFVFDLIVGPLFKLTALTRRSLDATEGNVHKPQPANERVSGHWPGD